MLSPHQEPTAREATMLRLALQGILDAVKEGGDLGAPGGVLYSALMDKISLAQFEQIMNVLVRMKKLRKQGQLYFWLADL